MATTSNILDDMKSYDSVDDRDIFSFIRVIKQGIDLAYFNKIAGKSPFSLNEKKTFNPLQSERILEIELLFRLGVEVFGSVERFNYWLENENLALGKIKPKELLDNTFGINLLKDELTRIEHGVLA